MSTRKNIQNKRGGWHQLTPAKKTGGNSAQDIIQLIQELTKVAAEQRTQALQVEETSGRLERLQSENTAQTGTISSLERELATIRESQKQYESATQELKRQLESSNQTNDLNITKINEELAKLQKAITG